MYDLILDHSYILLYLWKTKHRSSSGPIYTLTLLLWWATIGAFSFQSLGCGGPRSWLFRGGVKKKKVIFATYSLSGKLFILFFEKRKVFHSGFTFNMASPYENTDAGDSDFNMSTSEEEIDSQLESFLSCFSSDYVLLLLYLAQN